MQAEEIFQILRGLIAEQFGLAPEKVTMDTSFEEDLSADSIDLVELVMAMEEEFDIGEVQDEEVPKLKTVGDAVNFLSTKLK